MAGRTLAVLCDGIVLFGTSRPIRERHVHRKEEINHSRRGNAAGLEAGGFVLLDPPWFRLLVAPLESELVANHKADVVVRRLAFRCRDNRSTAKPGID